MPPPEGIGMLAPPDDGGVMAEVLQPAATNAAATSSISGFIQRTNGESILLCFIFLPSSGEV